MLGPVYTELSVILAPGQSPHTPFDVAAVSDTVTLTLTEPTPDAVPTVAPVSDTQALRLSTEVAAISGDAARSESWTLVYSDGLAISGTMDLTDTWTLSGTDINAGLDKGIYPLALSDDWALSVADVTVLAPYDINITELGSWGFPTAAHVYDAKAEGGVTPQLVSDTVTLQWFEEPFDLVQLDVWDDLKVTYSAESASFTLSQTYPASDSWIIRVVDAGAVAYLGSLPVPVTDAWSLPTNEAPSVVDISGDFTYDVSDSWTLAVSTEYGQLDLTTSVSSDTMTLSLSDVSTLVISYDVRDVSDSWSVQIADTSAMVIAGDVRAVTDTLTLTSLAEFGVPENFLPIPIEVSDEMRMDVSDDGQILSSRIRPPVSRRVKVRRGARHEDVKL